MKESLKPWIPVGGLKLKEKRTESACVNLSTVPLGKKLRMEFYKLP
jgi:hypothetical protein